MLEVNETLSSLESLINLVNSNFASNQQRDRGTTFEYIVLAYFRNEPKYSRYFDDVWLLSDVPSEYGISKQDKGVDLVGKKRYSGELVAIQAKYYGQDKKINKSDIDSFLNEVGKTYYSEGIVVSSTDNWSSTAEEAINNRSKNIIRIGFTELKNSKIDWSQFYFDSVTREESVKKEREKTPRPHQNKAIDKVLEGFKHNDRGKLIMAPGTGKTYTSLQVAERLAKNKRKLTDEPFTVLYLVPSIQLLSQALSGWTSDTTLKMDTFAVTADRHVTRKVRDDERDITVADIGFPATTNKDKLLENQQILNQSEDKSEIIVVFSTYHSIQVIGDAQKEGFFEFDLIVADEAHRTTGTTLIDEEESHFVKVHSNENIKANKRLYQTATPRVYGEKAIEKAIDESAVIAHMEDESIYGPEFFRLGFGDAVHDGILSDYKVMILAVDKDEAEKEIPETIGDLETESDFNNVMKIIGVWNGLLKRKGNSNELFGEPMKRAIAFTGTIKQSKYITETFDKVINEYLNSESYDAFNVDIQHADGSMNALEKNSKIEWLKSEVPDGESRILSNARFLTEGVDVPDLDAVLFMQPRKSKIDIAQAVGRVMRKSPGKEYGYVILPITTSTNKDAGMVLDNNEAYEVVWNVLNALRSIDERFDAIINKLDLNKKKPSQIEVTQIGEAPSVDEETGEYPIDVIYEQQSVFEFQEEWNELENLIFPEIVKKVGNVRYWESWSKDVAEIAQQHINKINKLLADTDNKKTRKAFDQFISGLRQNVNQSITVQETVEMLAQHLITKPVFDSLFEEESFALNNPISQAMSKMIDVLERNGFNRQQDKLADFYDSVSIRAQGIDNLEAKQRIIIQLYDNFFRVGFPNTTEQLGIVFTPTEVVDFIIQSVEEALQHYLGTSMDNKNVNILDPFTGTGTFVTRLLQSGIISKKNLLYKYTNEIFANEIVLLSYYIAAINIEETFKSVYETENYHPFPGIVLTDTFESTEKQPTLDDNIFSDNNERLNRQQEKPITVIMSNPPYSSGQNSANDNMQNKSYPELDQQIKETYVKWADNQSKISLYDSYIRAFKWASERINSEGVIGFVTNGQFIDSLSAKGLRKTWHEEFNYIYIYNLRGDARTSGEKRRKEAGNVFGSGTRTPIAITLLIKDGSSNKKIFYKDIGDYHNEKSKLNILQEQESIKNLDWVEITPNQNHDWINQRDDSFEDHFPMFSKNEDSIFMDYSPGAKTNRDPWVINFSKDELIDNVNMFIDNYTSELKKVDTTLPLNELKKSTNNDPKYIKWTAGLWRKLKNNQEIEYDSKYLRNIIYRPFTKKYTYYSKDLYERPSDYRDKMGTKNKFIVTTGVGTKSEFSALTVDELPENQLLSNAQVYYLYNNTPADENALFNFKEQYDVSEIANDYFELTTEDLFYYIYGILYSKDYRQRYANNLNKDNPRIPNVKNKEIYVEYGKKLAHLHLNYEDVEAYEGLEVEYKSDDPSYQVRKMKFNKKQNDKGKKIDDKSTIVFNKDIMIKNIPEKAYEFFIGTRSAVEWIMDQYRVKKDKKSGIIDDPNNFSDNPKYVFNLLLSIINLSVQTVDLVNELPPLDIIEE